MINMSGKGLKDLTKEERNCLEDNKPLLRKKIIQMIMQSREKRMYTSEIARNLFPTEGDRKQNFTRKDLLVPMEIDGILKFEKIGRESYWSVLKQC